MKRKTQSKDVAGRLKMWLLSGKSITSNQALRMWRTSRLAVYVHRLRKQGMKITCILVRDNEGGVYGKYVHEKKKKVNRILAGTYNRH